MLRYLLCRSIAVAVAADAAVYALNLNLLMAVLLTIGSCVWWKSASPKKTDPSTNN